MTKLYRREQGQDTLLPRMMEVEMKLVREMMTGEPYLMRPKNRLCIRIGLTESSNMLHYSNASSIEESRRYLVIKGGGACLVALARRGSSTP